MTYKDLYDEYLNSIHEGCDLCSRYGASRILEEVDPVAYRCGFSDWTDTLSDNPPMCGCGDRTVDETDVCMDDEVECDVCRGAHDCEKCGELVEDGEKCECGGGEDEED